MFVSAIINEISKVDINKGIDSFSDLFTIFYKPGDNLNKSLYDYLKKHINKETWDFLCIKIKHGIIKTLKNFENKEISDKFYDSYEIKTFKNIDVSVDKFNANIYKLLFVLKFIGFIKTFTDYRGYFEPINNYPKVFGLELIFPKHPEFLINNKEGINIFIKKIESIYDFLNLENINLKITTEYSKFNQQTNKINPLIFTFENSDIKRNDCLSSDTIINIIAGDSKINGGFMDTGSRMEEMTVIKKYYLILLLGIVNICFDENEDFLNVIDYNNNEVMVYVNACKNEKIKTNNTYYYNVKQFDNIEKEYNKLYYAFASVVSNTKKNNYFDGVVNMINWGLGYFNGLFILKLYTFLKVIKHFNFKIIRWNIYNDKNIQEQIKSITVKHNDRLYFDSSITDLMLNDILCLLKSMVSELFTEKDIIIPFKKYINESVETRYINIRIEMEKLKNYHWKPDIKDNKIIYYRDNEKKYYNYLMPPMIELPDNYEVCFIMHNYGIINVKSRYLYNFDEILKPN